MIKKLNRVIIVTGLVGITMFGSPFIQDNPIMDFISNTTTITAMAAESYSDNWYMENEVWHYKMSDGTKCTNAWVKDHGNWYLLDANGDMLTGLVKSNGGKYYLLDTVPGTGTYGKMLTNGSTFNGVTISASTYADDEGSLSEETKAQLRAIGVNVDAVPNVENTKHVENGRVVYPNDSNQTIEETVSETDIPQSSGNTTPPSTNSGSDNKAQKEVEDIIDGLPPMPGGQTTGESGTWT